MAPATPSTTFESALTRLKKVVYKQRVRVKDFIADFDKLRSGFVHPNHFLTALSMAGLDKELTPEELQLICDTYTVPRSPSLIMTDYKTFLNDVEIVFTLPVSGCSSAPALCSPFLLAHVCLSSGWTCACCVSWHAQNLEKTPLAEVAAEPIELLDKTRYERSSRVLPDAEEATFEEVIQVRRVHRIVLSRKDGCMCTRLAWGGRVRQGVRPPPPCTVCVQQPLHSAAIPPAADGKRCMARPCSAGLTAVLGGVAGQ